MAYRNASLLLPPKLLSEVQKYVSGETVYVPAPDTKKLRWGEKNGTKTKYSDRNREIRRLFCAGVGIEAIADRHCLSPETVKKIVYSQ